MSGTFLDMLDFAPNQEEIWWRD